VRALVTVLFTDVVGSTERAVALGDQRWGDLLESYHAEVRRRLRSSRGRVIDAVGDGCLALLDVPSRAIRCAGAIREAARRLGLEVRAAVHTGECELVGGRLRATRVRGVAVHIGARVLAHAAPGEILVSSTVKDVAAGSGLWFRDRGRRTLKGLPGTWRLFAAEVASGSQAILGSGQHPTQTGALRVTPLIPPRGALGRTRRRPASQRDGASLALLGDPCGAA
jgi:class 3 adenylate cyclase